MEVKINREIRGYTESMFFGLSLRQFIFSVFACGIAVVVYFLLKPSLGTETVSWLCILAAAPFSAIGFVKYNGLTAEKFIWAFIKSEILIPKRLVFRNSNLYYTLFSDLLGSDEELKKIRKKKRKQEKRLAKRNKRKSKRNRKKEDVINND